MNWATYCSVKTYKKTLYFPLIVGPGSVHMELYGNDISAWAPNYWVLEALLQRVFIYFKQQTQSPPRHCSRKGNEVHFKHRISHSTACNPSFQLPFLHCLTLDSGDKPSVTCVARVPQTENAFCTVKWMPLCETVLARKPAANTALKECWEELLQHRAGLELWICN